MNCKKHLQELNVIMLNMWMIWRATSFPPPLELKFLFFFQSWIRFVSLQQKMFSFPAAWTKNILFSPRKVSLRPILPIDLLKKKENKLRAALLQRICVNTPASALRHRLTSPITSQFKTTTVGKEAPGSWNHPDKNRPPSRSNTSHDHVCYNHQWKLKRHAKICQHLKKTQEKENRGWNLAASFLSQLLIREPQPASFDLSQTSA